MPARRRSSTARACSKDDAARRRVRRSRRAERLARPRPRVGARRRRSTTRSCSIQRDLFALGAQLADPGDKIAAARHESRRSRDDDVDAARSADRSARGRAAAAAPLHPRRRRAGRRRAARRADGLPPRRAPDGRARSRRSTPVLIRYVNRLSDLLFVARARRSIIARGVAGDRVVSGQRSRSSDRIVPRSTRA